MLHMLKELHPDIIDNTLTDDLEEDAINVCNHECQEDNCQNSSDSFLIPATSTERNQARSSGEKRCREDASMMYVPAGKTGWGALTTKGWEASAYPLRRSRPSCLALSGVTT